MDPQHNAVRTSNFTKCTCPLVYQQNRQ